MTSRQNDFQTMLSYSKLTLGSLGFSGVLELTEIADRLYVVEGILGENGLDHTVAIEFKYISERRAKIVLFVEEGGVSDYVDERDCWDFKKIVTFPLN